MNFNDFASLFATYVESAFDNKCDVFAPRDETWEHLCGMYLRGEGFVHHMANNEVFGKFIIHALGRGIERSGEPVVVDGKFPLDDFLKSMHSVIQVNNRNKVLSQIGIYLYFLHELCDIHDCESVNDVNDVCKFLFSIYVEAQSMNARSPYIYTPKAIREIYYRNRKSHPTDLKKWMLGILE